MPKHKVERIRWLIGSRKASSRYRVDFVDENGESVRNVLGAYSDLFAARGEHRRSGVCIRC